MNFRAIAIVVFLIAVSAGLLAHFRQQSVTVATTTKPTTDGIPVPPPTGPYGKAVVVGEPTYNFGVMEQGQSGSHEFKLRNDGPGPLKMVARKEDHTCQCTLGSLGTDGLKPGEETTVTLNWEIKKIATTFDHAAKIRTDDPDNPVIMFRVRGLVGRRLSIRTGTEILIGQLSESKVTERTFVVHSEIFDKFDITKLEPSSPAITATSRPLFGEELRDATRDPATLATEQAMKEAQRTEAEEKLASGEKPSETSHKGHSHNSYTPETVKDDLAGKSAEVKSGHEVKVVFGSGLPIGKFRESLTIHTDLADTPPMIVMFEGSRAGPIEILGTPGVAWSPQEGRLNLPRFRAQEGKKVKLLVFVKKTETPWEITEAKVFPTFLKYELIKDDKFKGSGRDRYDLYLEIPAGEAPVSFSGTNIGSLILNTNHPDAKVIRLDVDFISY